MSYPGDQPESDTAGFPAGTVIGGKYLVERLLGRGGMGVVLAAQHLQLREPVALKFLHGDMARKPALVARFEREGRAAARIKSEHVTRVLDVGWHDGVPFIVMELLAGTDLHKLSAERGPIPWTEAALYLAQACEAVAEAHLYGIVHRDLKPANLFLTHRADGSALIKVLDFGISKMAGEVDENLTATTDVLGSPLYMSPEQIENPRDVDARTDVWSLGAILYKLLAGRAAFAGPTAGSSLAKIVKDPPPPLHPQRPDLPPELDALVIRCLEKDVNDRVQSAAELGRALLPFTGQSPAEGTAPGASYSQPAAMRPPSAAPRPVALIAVGVGTLLGGALAIWLVGAHASRAAPLSPAAGPVATVAPAAPPTDPSPRPSTPPPPSAVPATTASGAASADAPPAASASARPPLLRPGKLPSPRAPSDAFSERL